MTALYIPLAFLSLIAVAAWCDYRRKRERKPMSTTEWRKGMAALDATMPIPAPRFRSKAVRVGAVGVCIPEPKKKLENIAPIRKKA